MTLRLVSVPSHLWLSRDPAAPLVLFGLLSHEQKMSVVNCVLQRHPAGHQRRVRAKERLVFHMGFRRFAVAPVFSQHTNGDKHKVGTAAYRPWSVLPAERGPVFLLVSVMSSKRVRSVIMM